MTSKPVPPTKLDLVVAPAARDDLAEIYRTSLANWGIAQADRYQELIRNHFRNLTEQPLLGMERPELMPGIRSLPLERHTLFYRICPRSIEVIRLLHGRQDAKRHFDKHH